MKSKLFILLTIVTLSIASTACADEEVNPIEANSNKGETGHLEDGF